jgi:CHAD domain-containing protein
MRDEARKALRRDVWSTNRKLKTIAEGISRPVLRAAIKANIDKRIEALLVADARFRRSSSNEDFHRIRVKFKRLRYAAEAAMPIIGGFTKVQMDGMRKLQKAMGEIHDLQTYLTALAEWTGRKPPHELQKEYDALMKAFEARPAWLEELNFRNRQ